MASVTCQRCKSQYAVIGCGECKTLVCTNCSTTCQVCGASSCLDHIHLTKGGRKLCGRCYAERQARQQALKEKYSGGQRPAPSAPAAPPAPNAPTPKSSQAPSAPSPSKPASAPGASAGYSPFAANRAARFSDIAGDEPLLPVRETEEDIDEEAGLGPVDDDPDMRLDPEEAKRNREARKTAGFTATGRLELPPMDENRPVLGQSGYQPPSRAKVIAAFVFFGIGMMYFYSATPYFKDTLFPFTTTELNFNEGEMAQIQDTNKLRNTSNIQQLNIFQQAPIFFVAWFILLSYLLGVFVLVLGIIRSTYWSHVAKRNLEASRNLDRDANELQ